MEIGNIEIGENVKPQNLPEIKINYNGSLKIVKEMETSAKSVLAGLIKNRVHFVNDE